MRLLPFVAAAAAAPNVLSRDNPTVDLGYAVHQASYSTNGDYYSFNNIRYADPPQRFAKPQAPTTTNRTVNTGTDVRTCPNAYPWWLINTLAPAMLVSPQALQTTVYSTPFNEDCLFLDVSVPRSIFAKRSTTGSSSTGGAAILVWIYGGGFTLGSKNDPDYNPTGLITQSQQGGQSGMIVIKINYRLGIFGWLGEGDGVTKNAGLWDQRLALNWVQKNAALFGGDPTKVTVMGQSAGGGSIMHHITAFGGAQGSAPFAQAVPQSPGFEIAPNPHLGLTKALEVATNMTGAALTTVDQLRALDSATLMEVNKQVVNASHQGSFTYGPVVDGDYVPDMPSNLLAQGKFDPKVKVMAGHNQREAATFIYNISTDADFRASVGVTLFGISSASIDNIASNIYPNDLSGKFGYTTQTRRLELFATESGFSCNTRYLARAYGNDTYSYIFTLSPAYHQQDVGFTFYNGNPLDSSVPMTVVNPSTALDMQGRFSRFVQSANPNGLLSLPQWPKYGTASKLVNFNMLTTTSTDDTANSRCDFWQSGAWKN